MKNLLIKVINKNAEEPLIQMMSFITAFIVSIAIISMLFFASKKFEHKPSAPDVTYTARR